MPQRVVNAELPRVPPLDPARPARTCREAGTLRAAQPWWPLRLMWAGPLLHRQQYPENRRCPSPALALPSRPWASAVTDQGGEPPDPRAAPRGSSVARPGLGPHLRPTWPHPSLALQEVHKLLQNFPRLRFLLPSAAGRPPAGTTGWRHAGGVRPTPLVPLLRGCQGSRVPARDQCYLKTVLPSTACQWPGSPGRTLGFGSRTPRLGWSPPLSSLVAPGKAPAIPGP